MWPLRYFESNEFMIGEIDNPASWAMVIFACAALLVYLLAVILMGSRVYRDSIRTKRNGILLGVVLSLLPLGGLLVDRSFLNLLIPLCGVAAIGHLGCAVVQLSREAQAGPEKRRLRILGVLAGVMVGLGILGVVTSFPYYLPASYPKTVRDQLRMMRRIVEAEPHAGDPERPFVSLAEAHLVVEGKELIPDSIRETAEYQGYRYTLVTDTPRKGLFVADAVPVRYSPGMRSFHAYPVDPEALDSSFPYVTYCISMGDKKGGIATEQDRHFHSRNLWALIVGRP